MDPRLLAKSFNRMQLLNEALFISNEMAGQMSFADGVADSGSYIAWWWMIPRQNSFDRIPYEVKWVERA